MCLINKEIILEYKKLCGASKDKYKVILMLDNDRFDCDAFLPVCNMVFWHAGKIFSFYICGNENFGQVMWCNADYECYFFVNIFLAMIDNLSGIVFAIYPFVKSVHKM